MYSFSQFEDGTFGFWGAGQAGWYKISPGPMYRGIYADMEEALSIFYFVADKYNGIRKMDSKNSAHSIEHQISKLFEEVGLEKSF